MLKMGRIPKKNQRGRSLFVEHRSEGSLQVSFRIRVNSDICPEQVITGVTRAKVHFMGFSGSRILSKAETLLKMTNTNLDLDGSCRIDFATPIYYVKVGWSPWSHVDVG